MNWTGTSPSLPIRRPLQTDRDRVEEAEHQARRPNTGNGLHLPKMRAARRDEALAGGHVRD